MQYMVLSNLLISCYVSAILHHMIEATHDSEPTDLRPWVPNTGLLVRISTWLIIGLLGMWYVTELSYHANLVKKSLIAARNEKNFRTRPTFPTSNPLPSGSGLKPNPHLYYNVA